MKTIQDFKKEESIKNYALFNQALRNKLNKPLGRLITIKSVRQ